MNEGSGMFNCAVYPGPDLSWQSAITHGCQGIQVQLAEMTSVNDILYLYQNLNFFSPPGIRLNVAQADPPDVNAQESLYAGEGSFNLTPLQIALAASALTNQGIMPAPRIVNGYQNSQGDWITLPKLGQNIQAVDTQSSIWITNLMEDIESPHWQVTSVVNTEDDQNITWFIAGTVPDWQGQPTTVVVLLERNAPELAEEIGLSLLDQTIQSSPSE
jgi:membrane carboxypeptidase/penicillin-binding protein